MHRSFEDIFEVPYASKFRALRSSVRFEVPCASKFRAVTLHNHRPIRYDRTVNHVGVIKPFSPLQWLMLYDLRAWKGLYITASYSLLKSVIKLHLPYFNIQ